jgi:hypothetical protein
MINASASNTSVAHPWPHYRLATTMPSQPAHHLAEVARSVAISIGTVGQELSQCCDTHQTHNQELVAVLADTQLHLKHLVDLIYTHHHGASDTATSSLRTAALVLLGDGRRMGTLLRSILGNHLDRLDIRFGKRLLQAWQALVADIKDACDMINAVDSGAVSGSVPTTPYAGQQRAGTVSDMFHLTSQAVDTCLPALDLLAAQLAQDQQLAQAPNASLLQSHTITAQQACDKVMESLQSGRLDTNAWRRVQTDINVFVVSMTRLSSTAKTVAKSHRFSPMLLAALQQATRATKELVLQLQSSSSAASK